MELRILCSVGRKRPNRPNPDHFQSFTPKTAEKPDWPAERSLKHSDHFTLCFQRFQSFTNEFPKSLLYPQSRTGPQPATPETPVPTQSQIEANRPTPKNATGPASVTSQAFSSLNSPKTGAQAKIPPSPRKGTGDRPVCVTKSLPMSATHSRKMAYPHTRNTHGFRALRHNAPAQPATRPIAHSRNPLVGQLGKAARHPEGTPFTGAPGGAGPVPPCPEETQPLTPPIGFVPPIASASPPPTRRQRPPVSHENHRTAPEAATLEPWRSAALAHQPPATHTAHEDRSNRRQPAFRTLPELGARNCFSQPPPPTLALHVWRVACV